MSRFSKKALDKLKKSGWRNNRKVDISTVLNVAKKENCILTKNMIEFLHEFQGLKLAYNNGEELFDFTPYVYSITNKNCLLWSSLVGEAVFKIGVMSNSNYLILISESNKMYAFTSGENDIFIIGNSFDEGIDFILTYGLKETPSIFNKKRIK